MFHRTIASLDTHRSRLVTRREKRNVLMTKLDGSCDPTVRLPTNFLYTTLSSVAPLGSWVNTKNIQALACLVLKQGNATARAIDKLAKLQETTTNQLQALLPPIDFLLAQFEVGCKQNNTLFPEFCCLDFKNNTDTLKTIRHQAEII